MNPESQSPEPSIQAMRTAAERLAALRSHLEISAASLRIAARIFATMVEAGDDTRPVGAQVSRMLARIHARQLLPEVVTTLAGQVRQLVAELPVPLQRDLVAPGARQPIYAPASGAVIGVDGVRLTPQQARQLIDPVRKILRAPEEQAAWVHGQATERAPAAAAGLHDNKIQVDVPGGLIRVTAPTILTRRQLQILLESLSRSRGHAEDYSGIQERLSAGESLAEIARKRGIPYQTLYQRYNRWLALRAKT